MLPYLIKYLDSALKEEGIDLTFIGEGTWHVAKGPCLNSKEQFITQIGDGLFIKDVGPYSLAEAIIVIKIKYYGECTTEEWCVLHGDI